MIAALGVNAISQIYQSLRGQGTGPANDPPRAASDTAGQSSAANAAGQSSAANAAGQSSAANAAGQTPVRLNIPTKLSTDIDALLLDLRSSNASGAASPATAGTSVAPTAAAPSAAVQTDLQTLSNDLQPPGAGRHQHRHGQPGNDASEGAVTAPGTSTTAGAGHGSLFAKLNQALNAYASQSAAAGAGSVSAGSTSLTA